MSDGPPHELSAAYALDALEGEELRAFEAHLATCDSCREDVASLRATAAELAYDAPPRAAPELLERRILNAARAERPARGERRWAFPAAGVAVAAAAAAIALAIWATHLSSSLDRARSAHKRDARVIAILAQPGAR